GVRVIADVTGDPVDLDRFGPDLRSLATRLGVVRVVFDPYDEHLARHFRKPVPMNGRDYANACATFARELEGGRLHHEASGQIGDDRAWATRRSLPGGAWMAVKAKDERPITALLAAIRAIGSAYGPVSIGRARIY